MSKNPVKAYQHRQTRKQLLEFKGQPELYKSADTTPAAESLNKAEDALKNALAEASKFFKEGTLPTETKSREQALIDFLHIQNGERSNRLGRKRPPAQEDKDFTQPGTRNQVKPIGELNQKADKLEAEALKVMASTNETEDEQKKRELNQKAQNLQSEVQALRRKAQELTSHYQQAKQLEPFFLQPSEDAQAWLAKSQTLLEKRDHRQFIFDKLEGQNENLAKLKNMAENPDTLTDQELDDASEMLADFTKSENLAAKQAAIDAQIGALNLKRTEKDENQEDKVTHEDQITKLKILGAEQFAPGLNAMLAELDRERVKLREALQDYKSRPGNKALEKELNSQQKKFDEAFIKVRQQLANVSGEILKSANIADSNLAQVYADLEAMRLATKSGYGSQLKDWYTISQTKKPSSDISKIGSDINSLEISDKNVLMTWARQRDGSVKKIAHFHKDKDGNMVPTKLSVKTMLAFATRVQTDPEYAKLYGPVKVMTKRDKSGNIIKVKLRFPSEQHKENAISAMIGMQQQLDKEQQAKMEGEPKSPTDSAKATMTDDSDSPKPAPLEDKTLHTAVTPMWKQEERGESKRKTQELPEDGHNSRPSA